MKNIECLLCHHIFNHTKSFTCHLKKEHNTTAKDYYDKFLKKDDNDGICLTCKEPSKFINVTAGYCRYCCKSCGSLGPNNVFKKPEIQNKIKQTNLLKYGFEVASKNSSVIEKGKKTCIEKYGVISTLINPDTQKKIKEINKQRYGFENPFNNPKIQQQIRQRNLEKFGFEHPLQSKKFKEKAKQTCLKNHGVDNYSKTFEFRKFAREQFIQRVQEQKLNGEPLSPRIGFLERECFKILETLTPYPITKENFIGYFPDGYIKELNLIIEFYEEWHTSSTYSINHDKQRKEDLEKFLHCNFYIIYEREWIENPEKEIQRFKDFLTLLEQGRN